MGNCNQKRDKGTVWDRNGTAKWDSDRIGKLQSQNGTMGQWDNETMCDRNAQRKCEMEQWQKWDNVWQQWDNLYPAIGRSGSVTLSNKVSTNDEIEISY